jgi:hypothetical protein
MVCASEIAKDRGKYVKNSCTTFGSQGNTKDMERSTKFKGLRVHPRTGYGCVHTGHLLFSLYGNTTFFFWPRCSGSRWCLTPKVSSSSRDRYKQQKDKQETNNTKTRRKKQRGTISKERKETRGGRAIGRSDLLLQSVFILLSLDLRHLYDNKEGAKRKERDYSIPKLVLSLGAGRILFFSFSVL